MAMNYYFSFLIFRIFLAISTVIYLISINTLSVLLHPLQHLQIYGTLNEN